MKKYVLVAMLVMGIAGTTTIFAQEGPKAEKKEKKMDKKEDKMEKKEFHGSDRKATKKKEKAEKKMDKQDIKENMHK